MRNLIIPDGRDIDADSAYSSMSGFSHGTGKQSQQPTRRFWIGSNDKKKSVYAPRDNFSQNENTQTTKLQSRSIFSGTPRIKVPPQGPPISTYDIDTPTKDIKPPYVLQQQELIDDSVKAKTSLKQTKTEKTTKEKKKDSEKLATSDSEPVKRAMKQIGENEHLRRSKRLMEMNERKKINSKKKDERRRVAEARLSEQEELVKKEKRKDRKAMRKNSMARVRPIKRLILRSPAELAALYRIEETLKQRNILHQAQSRKLRFAVRCLQQDGDKLGLTTDEMAAIQRGDVLHLDEVRLENIAAGIDILDKDGYLALAAETYINGLKNFTGDTRIKDMGVYAPLDGSPQEGGDAYNYANYYSDVEASSPSDMDSGDSGEDELMLGDEAGNFMDTNFPYAVGALSDDDGYDDGYVYSKTKVPLPQMDVSVSVEDNQSIFARVSDYLPWKKKPATQTENTKPAEYIEITVRTDKEKTTQPAAAQKKDEATSGFANDVLSVQEEQRQQEERLREKKRMGLQLGRGKGLANQKPKNATKGINNLGPSIGKPELPSTKKKQLKNTAPLVMKDILQAHNDSSRVKVGTVIDQSLSTLQNVVDTRTTETTNTSSPSASSPSAPSPSDSNRVILPDAAAAVTNIDPAQINAKIEKLQSSLNRILTDNVTNSNALATSVKNNTDALQNVLSLVNTLSDQENTAMNILLSKADENKNDVEMANALWDAFQDISKKMSEYAERYSTREQLQQAESRQTDLIRDISANTKQITSEMATNQNMVFKALHELANIVKDLTNKSSSSVAAAPTAPNINELALEHMQQVIKSLSQQQERMGATTNEAINSLSTTLKETLRAVQAMKSQPYLQSPSASSEEILRDTSRVLTEAFTKFIEMSQQMQFALNKMTEQSMTQSEIALAPIGSFNRELLSQNQANTDELRKLIRTQIEGMKVITEKNAEMEKYRQTSVEKLLQHLDDKNDKLLAEFGKQLSDTQERVKEMQSKFTSAAAIASGAGGGGSGDGDGGDGGGGDNTMKAKGKSAKKQTSPSSLLAASGGSGDPGGGDDGSGLLQVLDNIARTFAEYTKEIGAISMRPLQIIQQPEKAVPAFPNKIVVKIENDEALGGSLNKIQNALDGIQQSFTAEKSNQSYAQQPQPQLVVPDKITLKVEGPLTDSNMNNELIAKILDNTEAMMERTDKRVADLMQLLQNKESENDDGTSKPSKFNTVEYDRLFTKTINAFRDTISEQAKLLRETANSSRSQQNEFFTNIQQSYDKLINTSIEAQLSKLEKLQEQRYEEIEKKMREQSEQLSQRQEQQQQQQQQQQQPQINVSLKEDVKTITDELRNYGEEMKRLTIENLRAQQGQQLQLFSNQEKLLTNLSVRRSGLDDEIFKLKSSIEELTKKVSSSENEKKEIKNEDANRIAAEERTLKALSNQQDILIGIQKQLQTQMLSQKAASAEGEAASQKSVIEVLQKMLSSINDMTTQLFQSKKESESENLTRVVKDSLKEMYEQHMKIMEKLMAQNGETLKTYNKIAQLQLENENKLSIPDKKSPSSATTLVRENLELDLNEGITRLEKNQQEMEDKLKALLETEKSDRMNQTLYVMEKLNALSDEMKKQKTTSEYSFLSQNISKMLEALKTTNEQLGNLSKSTDAFKESTSLALMEVNTIYVDEMKNVIARLERNNDDRTEHLELLFLDVLKSIKELLGNNNSGYARRRERSPESDIEKQRFKKKKVKLFSDINVGNLTSGVDKSSCVSCAYVKTPKKTNKYHSSERKIALQDLDGDENDPIYMVGNRIQNMPLTTSKRPTDSSSTAGDSSGKRAAGDGDGDDGSGSLGKQTNDSSKDVSGGSSTSSSGSGNGGGNGDGAGDGDGDGGSNGGGDDSGDDSGEDRGRSRRLSSTQSDSGEREENEEATNVNRRSYSSGIKVNGYCDYDCDEDIRLLETLCMDPCDMDANVDITPAIQCLQSARRDASVSQLDHCRSVIKALLDIGQYELASKMRVQEHKLSIYSKINEYRLKNKEEDQKTYRIMEAIANKTRTAIANADLVKAQTLKQNIENELQQINIPKLIMEMKNSQAEQQRKIVEHEYYTRRWLNKDVKPNANAWNKTLKKYINETKKNKGKAPVSGAQRIKTSAASGKGKSSAPGKGKSSASGKGSAFKRFDDNTKTSTITYSNTPKSSSKLSNAPATKLRQSNEYANVFDDDDDDDADVVFEDANEHFEDTSLSDSDSKNEQRRRRQAATKKTTEKKSEKQSGTPVKSKKINENVETKQKGQKHQTKKQTKE